MNDSYLYTNYTSAANPKSVVTDKKDATITVQLPNFDTGAKSFAIVNKLCVPSSLLPEVELTITDQYSHYGIPLKMVEFATTCKLGIIPSVYLSTYCMVNNTNNNWTDEPVASRSFIQTIFVRPDTTVYTGGEGSIVSQTEQGTITLNKYTSLLEGINIALARCMAITEPRNNAGFFITENGYLMLSQEFELQPNMESINITGAYSADFSPEEIFSLNGINQPGNALCKTTFTICANQDLCNQMKGLPWRKITKECANDIASRLVFPSEILNDVIDNHGIWYFLDTQQSKYITNAQTNGKTTLSLFFIDFNAINMSPVDKILLISEGCPIASESQPLLFGDSVSAQINTNKIPILSSYYPILTRQSDKYGDMIVISQNIKDGALINITGLTLSFMRYFTLRVSWISKSGKHHNHYLLPNENISCQICWL